MLGNGVMTRGGKPLWVVGEITAAALRAAAYRAAISRAVMYRAAVSASLADAAGSDYSCPQVCFKKQTCLHIVLYKMLPSVLKSML